MRTKCVLIIFIFSLGLFVRSVAQGNDIFQIGTIEICCPPADGEIITLALGPDGGYNHWEVGQSDSIEYEWECQWLDNLGTNRDTDVELWPLTEVGPFKVYGTATVIREGAEIPEVSDIHLDSVIIKCYRPPVLDLGDTAYMCPGDTITLDAGEGFETYDWDDGIANAKREVWTAGLYKITVQDSCGNEYSDSIEVIMHQEPDVDIGGSAIFCEGSPIGNSGPLGGTWYLNGAVYDIGRITHVSISGNYILFVTDPLTGCSNSDTISVMVIDRPEVDLGPDTCICPGDSIELDAGDKTNKYDWWPGGEDTDSILVHEAGTYGVQVTGTNGCSAKDSIQVDFCPVPDLDLGTDTTICEGDTMTLDAGTGFETYLWFPGGETSQNIKVMNTGRYKVTATTVDGCKAVDSIDITVAPVPVVDLGHDTCICPEGVITLYSGTGTGAGYSYSWSPGDENTSSIVARSAGLYSVSVTNEHGCSAADTIVIDLCPAPSISLGNDTSICSGESLLLDAGPGYGSYSWSPGGEVSQTINVTSEGLYGVTVTNEYGCEGTDSIHVGINTLPVVHLGPDTIMCEGDTLQLDAGSGYITYLWSPGGETIQKIEITTGGTYIVEVTDGNGCLGSDTIVVAFNNCSSIADFPASNEGFSIYPNPTNGNFTLIMNRLEGNWKLNIYDMQGRIIMKNQISCNDNGCSKELDLSDQPEGIYLLIIAQGSQQQSFHILIHR